MNSTTYFIHADWLGTERVRTGVTGSVAETCQSLPYGDGMSCSGSDVSALHFTGKMHDTESNLDDFGARYYASTAGRFITPDEPFADQSASDSQSWNPYSYVRNNPLRAVDPTGNACVSTDNGKTFHNDNSGGQPCAEAFSPQQNNTASAVVSGQPGSALTSFLINAFITLDNAANDYFAPVLGGYRPSYMQNTETGSGTAANLGVATAIVGTALIGPEGDAEDVGSAAETIANGHAFEKHAGDLEKLGIPNREALKSAIQRLMEDARKEDVRTLSGGRIAYWDDSRGLVVIYNPSAADKGTVFKPAAGKAYFEALR